MSYWFLPLIMQRKALRKTAFTHHGKYVPLSSAKRIGFTATTDTPGIMEAIRLLTWKVANTDLEIAGVILDTKDQAERGTLSPSIRILQRRNLNWYGLPKPGSLGDFISKPFDILIDLTCGKRPFPIVYLLHNAKASLRIGIEPSAKMHYDMIVNRTSGDAGPEELIKNITKYLTTIQ